jgi:hypothetical protein
VLDSFRHGPACGRQICRGNVRGWIVTTGLAAEHNVPAIIMIVESVKKHELISTSTLIYSGITSIALWDVIADQGMTYVLSSMRSVSQERCQAPNEPLCIASNATRGHHVAWKTGSVKIQEQTHGSIC